MAKVGSRQPPQRDTSERAQPRERSGAGVPRGGERADLTAKETRREQHRAVRAAAARAHVRKQRTRQIVLIAGTILGVGALILVLVLVVSHQRKAVPLIGTSLPEEGRTHVPDGSKLTFRHYPPASGNHYPTPAAAGFYTTPVAEGNWVHSLEHGYIVILYKPSVDAATIQELRDLMTSFPKEKYNEVKLVVTPYDHMDNPITAVMWDRELALDQFDRDQLLSFYQADVDHGPEDIP